MSVYQKHRKRFKLSMCLSLFLSLSFLCRANENLISLSLLPFSLLVSFQYENDQSVLKQSAPEFIDKHVSYNKLLPSPSPTLPQPLMFSESIAMTSMVASGQGPGPTNSPTPVDEQCTPQQPPQDNGGNNQNEPPEPDPLNDGIETSLANSQSNLLDSITLFASAPGGDGDPDDPEGSGTAYLTPDEKKTAYEQLRRQVHEARVYQLKQAWHLMPKILAFSRQHPEYAIRCYELLGHLIRYEALAVNTVVKLAFSLSLGISAFEDPLLASFRTSVIVTGDTVASLIPWLFPEHTWLEYLSLLTGSTIMAVADNGFAHWTNSSYALPWLSSDLVNYEIRVFFLYNLNVWILKNIYSGALIAGAARLMHKYQILLLAVDSAMKPILLYLSVAGVVFTAPVISITCAPNPLAPHSFPFSNYCPDIPWVLWQIGCNASDINYEDNPEDSCEPEVICQNHCNCTGLQFPSVKN